MSGRPGDGRLPPEDAGHHGGPSPLLEWLATQVLPPDTRDAALGDLHERYLDRLRRAGRAAAGRWYARQVLGFLVRVPLARARTAAADAANGFCSTSGWSVDLRDASRAVVRERGLTAAVVIVLGLAVGAATAVFSVVSAVLLRPLPFAQPEKLVMLWDEWPEADAAAAEPKPLSLAHVRAWRAETDLFVSAGAFESIPAVIDAGRWPESVDAALVSASLLPTLGVRAARGRLFTPEDDLPGAPLVAILSHELWQSRFGGDDTVIGRSVDIDGEPTQIVGVMPGDFWFYDPYAATRSYRGSSASAARLWRPLAGRFAEELDYPRYRMVARLRPGVTIDSAIARLAAVEQRLPLDRASADGRFRIVPLDEQVAGRVRPRLLGLSAAVGLVLLVAGVNLVSLLVARFDVRRPEFAIRAALGAGRGRLARALMFHGALLSLAGAAAGVLAAAAAIPLLLELVPRGLPLAHRAGIDPGVIAFALAVSLTIGLAVAALAAARLGPAGLTTAIGARSRTVAGRVASGRLTNAMTTAEVALSLVLLISATLLLRSMVATYRTDAGFDRRNTLTFQSLLMLSSPDASPDVSFFDHLEARVATLPGVVSAGSATVLPFSRWGQTAAFRLDSRENHARPVRVNYRLVSPGYFETLRVGQLAGRSFTGADASGAPAVAVVNRAFADRYLAGGPVVGRRVTVTHGREIERQIVGVVQNVKEDRLFAADRPILYAPIAQSPRPMRQFVVRTTTAPEALIEPIRQAAAALDRHQPLQRFITLETLVAQSMEEERFYAVVAGAFAGIAVLLALCGLYGVVSFAVRQRDREVGVRIALGASRQAVYRLILIDGMRPVAVGLVLGCLGAFGTGRLLRTLIHGVHEVDAVSYVAATVAFTTIAVLACLVPARRAAATDPVQTLSRG